MLYYFLLALFYGSCKTGLWPTITKIDIFHEKTFQSYKSWFTAKQICNLQRISFVTLSFFHFLLLEFFLLFSSLFSTEIMWFAVTFIIFLKWHQYSKVHDGIKLMMNFHSKLIDNFFFRGESNLILLTEKSIIFWCPDENFFISIF